MPNVSSVKSKFFEPQGVSAALVSASAAATTLVIADGGPYGNLTETILYIQVPTIVEELLILLEPMEMEMLKQRLLQDLMQVL